MSNYCENFIVDGKCSNCGADVEDTDKYCHECGKRIYPVERKSEQEAVKQRHFDVYRRWLDGPTHKEIADEFGMSASNVAIIAHSVVGRMYVHELPDDIRERATEMLGELRDNDKLWNHYERLKVIRKL